MKCEHEWYVDPVLMGHKCKKCRRFLTNEEVDEMLDCELDEDFVNIMVETHLSSEEQINEKKNENF